MNNLTLFDLSTFIPKHYVINKHKFKVSYELRMGENQAQVFYIYHPPSLVGQSTATVYFWIMGYKSIDNDLDFPLFTFGIMFNHGNAGDWMAKGSDRMSTNMVKKTSISDLLKNHLDIPLENWIGNSSFRTPENMNILKDILLSK